MTWTRVLATGSGDLAWRLAIDGLPYEAVTHRAMEGTASDGRERYVGLRSDGIRIAERLQSPPHATLRSEGMTLELADVSRRWTGLFAKQPDKVTHFTGATVDTGDNSFEVASTAGWPESGEFYVDSETCFYTGKDATHFTGVSRGWFGSLPQYHYSTFGARLRYPEVTNWPRVRDGRRARLYAYGPGDAKTGDGTLVWIGVVRGEPRFNGVAWTVILDPITSILDQDIGVDLDEPRRLRGIYYPANAPLVIEVIEHDSAEATGVYKARTSLALAGFWESQEAFCTALTTALATAQTNVIGTGTFTQDMRAVPDGTRWAFQYATDATTPHAMRVRMDSPLDGRITYNSSRSVDTGEAVTTVTGDKVYKLPLVPEPTRPHPGEVPRVSLTQNNRAMFDAASVPSTNQTGLDPATYPTGRLYLDSAPPSTATSVLVKWPAAEEDGEEQSFAVPITATSSASASIDTDWRAVAGFTTATGPQAQEVECKFGLDVATGTLSDFIAALAGQTAQYLNTGGTPYIRPGTNADFDLSDSELAHLADNPVTGNRRYTLLAKTNLKELLTHECRLAGVYMCTNASGKIVFRRMRLPVATESPENTIAASTIVVSDNLLAFEPSAFGLFNAVELATGYDAAEDEHRGELFRVRDVAAFGQNPVMRAIAIAPKSEDGAPVTYEDAVQVGHRILSVYGAPYQVVTLAVDLRRFALRLGDVVSVTWSKIPGNDGTLGVSSKVGIVLGRRFEPMRARGELTVLLTEQRVAGYVPSAKITAISGTSGGTGPFVLTLSSDYFAGSDDAETHWQIGDAIRVYKWGSSTASAETGEVTAVDGFTVTITTDSAWTTTGTWAIGSQVSTVIDRANQQRYVYMGSSSRIVTWSGSTDPAFTLA